MKHYKAIFPACSSLMMIFTLVFSAVTRADDPTSIPGIKPIIPSGKHLALPSSSPLAAMTLKGQLFPQAKGIRSIKSSGDGGWSASGNMLILNQRGDAKSSPPMRPFSRLPAGSQVSSIYWRIQTSQPLPVGVSMTICMPDRCLPLDGQAGRSDALAGEPAENPLTLVLKMAGQGVITPPVVVKFYQLQVNYRNGTTR